MGDDGDQMRARHMTERMVRMRRRRRWRGDRDSCCRDLQEWRGKREGREKEGRGKGGVEWDAKGRKEKGDFACETACTGE